MWMLRNYLRALASTRAYRAYTQPGDSYRLPLGKSDQVEAVLLTVRLNLAPAVMAT